MLDGTIVDRAVRIASTRINSKNVNEIAGCNIAQAYYGSIFERFTDVLKNGNVDLTLKGHFVYALTKKPEELWPILFKEKDILKAIKARRKGYQEGFKLLTDALNARPS